MKSLTVTNPTSGVDHIVTFKAKNHSPGKLVIRLDGRNVGKINRASKSIFVDRPEVYKAIENNIDAILSDN